MTTTLLIATYNWVDALRLVLHSVLKQTEMPDEIIIADDGSRADTKALIDEMREQFSVPLIHVWHEDTGFRLAEIRNKAIAKATSDYILQIDGDIILHKDFVKDHKRLATKNCFVTGSRVLLKPEITKRILTEGKSNLSFFSRGIKNRINAIRFPLFNSFVSPKNRPLYKMYLSIRGCNMAFWRKDLMEINGYDETFVGWGREDSDIVIRLINKGLYRKKIKFGAIQYHIYHKENSKDNLEENHKILEKSLQGGVFWAKQGIVKE